MPTVRSVVSDGKFYGLPPDKENAGGCYDSRDHGDQHRLPWPVADSRHDTDVPDGSNAL